jgi:hypothetical protein
MATVFPPDGMHFENVCGCSRPGGGCASRGEQTRVGWTRSATGGAPVRKLYLKGGMS